MFVYFAMPTKMLDSIKVQLETMKAVMEGDLTLKSSSSQKAAQLKDLVAQFKLRK